MPGALTVPQSIVTACAGREKHRATKTSSRRIGISCRRPIGRSIASVGLLSVWPNFNEKHGRPRPLGMCARPARAAYDRCHTQVRIAKKKRARSYLKGRWRPASRSTGIEPHQRLREQLFRRGAWMLAERLRAAGLSVRLDAAPLDLVAEVLAEIQGDPVRLMDGESLPSRS